MRWTAKDAPSHCAKEKRELWSYTANRALDDGKSEDEAIKLADAAVRADDTDDDDQNGTPPGKKKKGGDDDEETGDDDDNDTSRRQPRVAAFDEQLDMMERRAPIEIKKNSYDPETRTARAVWSVGARVRRHDFWTGDEWDEVLDMSPSSVRLGRFNAGAQLLDNHGIWGGLNSILGAIVPGTARIENGELVSDVKFSRSDKGERVARDLADGIPIVLSTAYKTHRQITDTTTSPPTRTAIDWEPFEGSVVTVPADVDASIRSILTMRARDLPPSEKDSTMNTRANGAGGQGAAAHNDENNRQQNQDNNNQQRQDQRDERGGGGGGGGDDRREQRQDQRDERNTDRERNTGERNTGERNADRERNTERERGNDRQRNERDQQGAGYASEMLGIAKRAGLSIDVVEKAIADGETPAAFRDRALDILAGKSRQGGPRGGAHGSGQNPDTGRVGPDGTVVRDETEGRAEAMAEALTIRILQSRRDQPGISDKDKDWCERMGRVDMIAKSRRIFDGHDKPQNERTRSYLGASIVELAAECVGWTKRILPRDVPSILEAALHPGSVGMRAGAMGGFQSTSDFPAIFLNALNKALLARYELQAPTYRQIAVERPFTDFRPHYMVRTGDFPQPQPLTETGEIRVGSSVDSKEVASVLPYGIIFPVSRQTFVNDEMGAIDQILSDSGNSVLVFENTTFFAMFNNNPVLQQDNTAVFASGHNNLAGAGTVPSVLSISAARTSLREMKTLSGNFINVPPSLILCGPQLETVVDQMVTSITPTLTTSVNPFSGRLRSVSDANITDTSWFIMAEPGRVPCFIYGFLSGGFGPRLRTEEPFGVQGLRVSLELDFGVGAIDYRGAYKNPGALPT